MHAKKIFLIFIISFFIFNVTYAANLTATIDIVADKTSVAPGDEVTFTLTIKDIANADGDCIAAMSGNIDYDKNFFETITETAIQPSGSAGINTETGKFTYTLSANAGTTTTIGTIKLKVKSTATGSGNVNFSNLASSDGETSATSANKSITISIKENSSSGSESGSGSSNSGSESSSSSSNSSSKSESSSSSSSSQSTSSTSGSASNSSSSQTENKSKNALPKTGTNAITIIGFLAVSIVISTILYVKYSQHKDF